MKNFFSKYSYSVVKMFVNQFAISIFGAGLWAAMAGLGNKALLVGISIFAILFYLFLIYNMTWEIGAKDKISVDVGKKVYRPLTGLWMSLLANVPNFLLAILYTVCRVFSPKLDSIGAIPRVGLLLFEGMYYGLVTEIYKIVEVTEAHPEGRMYIHEFCQTYFIVIIPAIITASVAYYLGHKNFKFIAGLFNKKPDAANKK